MIREIHPPIIWELHTQSWQDKPPVRSGMKSPGVKVEMERYRSEIRGCCSLHAGATYLRPFKSHFPTVAAPTTDEWLKESCSYGLREWRRLKETRSGPAVVIGLLMGQWAWLPITISITDAMVWILELRIYIHVGVEMLASVYSCVLGNEWLCVKISQSRKVCACM